jgi:hypothetical protein
MQLYFPEDLQKGLMNYIHKGKSLPHISLLYFRGLRITSVPGKLIAKAVAHPIFSATAPFRLTIQPEQFAGRKKHSADLLALILQLIISTHRSKALYLILLDIAKAFDTVWRDALWAKLIAQGHSLKHVAWLRALYNKLMTAVKSGNVVSRFVELLNGIGQGDTNSTPLHGAFLNDLPALLTTEGIGISLFNVFISILLFLDDVCIPCYSPSQVLHALNTMHLYATKWRITYNLDKGKSAIL